MRFLISPAYKSTPKKKKNCFEWCRLKHRNPKWYIAIFDNVQLCSLDTIPQENSSTFITSLRRKRLLIKQAVRNGTTRGMSVTHQPLRRRQLTGCQRFLRGSGGTRARAAPRAGYGAGPGWPRARVAAVTARPGGARGRPRWISRVIHAWKPRSKHPAGVTAPKHTEQPALRAPGRTPGSPGGGAGQPLPAPHRPGTGGQAPGWAPRQQPRACTAWQTRLAPSWMGREVALGTCVP